MQHNMEQMISELRMWNRNLNFAMDQRKRSDLALGSLLRTALGWSPTIPKSESEAIKAQALELIAIGEKFLKQQAKPEGKRKAVELTPLFYQWQDVILASIQSRAPYAAVEEHAVENMKRIAADLPSAPWWNDNVFSSTVKSLAVIVAEAGDISQYANPGKLWKRMGLAPIQKGDRTAAGSSWRKGGLTAEDWTTAGYSKRRRSSMWQIGESLIKGESQYRQVYLDRKEYERGQAAARGLKVAPAAKIPAKRAAEFISDGHIHIRAQRYMEKRLLKHLWQEWRRAVVQTSARKEMPAANLACLSG